MSKPKPKKPKKQLEATATKEKKSKTPSEDLASPDLDRQTSGDLWGDGADDPSKDGDEGWDDDGGEGGGDEWGDLSETAETTSKPVVVAKTPYRVLDSKTVASRRDKFISENADLMGLSIDEMDLLLRYLRYDENKIDRFVNDSKTKADVRLQSGIRGEAKRPKPPTTKTVDCAAWCSTVPLSEAHALNCGHYLCNDCWKGFLKSEVNAGIVTVFSKCPAQDDKGKKCQEPVDYTTMKKYLEAADLAKLDRWILDHFVDCSPVLKWCPKAGCGFAIEYDGGDACDVFCKCSTSFCFHCLNPAHSPSPCDLTKKWIALTNDEEAASERLIQSLTKPCPKCNTRIEKNRQCNHMKCTKCSYDFCWQCMQAIVIGATHPSWYVCKNREKAQAEGKLDKMEEDRLKLTEFLTKFAWHKSRTEDCRKHNKSSNALLHKISVAEGKMSDGRTLNWLSVIVKGIAEAHRFLEWSYVYSYFMEDNARKETFVNWQKILEEKADGMLKELEKALSDLDNFPKYLTTETKKITEIKKSTEVLTQKMKQMGELADEVSASLRHEADVKTTVWSCTRCSKESPDVVKDTTTKVIVCGSCGACRAHGDLDCLVLTCKKAT